MTEECSAIGAVTALASVRLPLAGLNSKTRSESESALPSPGPVMTSSAFVDVGLLGPTCVGGAEQTASALTGREEWLLGEDCPGRRGSTGVEDPDAALREHVDVRTDGGTARPSAVDGGGDVAGARQRRPCVGGWTVFIDLVLPAVPTDHVDIAVDCC